ncbi:MAG: hypothetical protein AB7F59_08605 [Bdellovibrionales bacterium]
MILVSQNVRPKAWRSYSYSQSGLFMIFMNFDESDDPHSTGARSYFVFPRKMEPRFQFTENELEVLDAAGHLHRFDLRTAKYLSMSESVLEVNSKIVRENQGGFKIKSSKHLLLDNGFALGELPYVDENASSFFRLEEKTCTVHHRELFSYTYGKRPDGTRYLEGVRFKLSDTEVLRKVQSCFSY